MRFKFKCLPSNSDSMSRIWAQWPLTACFGLILSFYVLKNIETQNWLRRQNKNVAIVKARWFEFFWLFFDFECSSTLFFFFTIFLIFVKNESFIAFADETPSCIYAFVHTSAIVYSTFVTIFDCITIATTINSKFLVMQSPNKCIRSLEAFFSHWFVRS